MPVTTCSTAISTSAIPTAMPTTTSMPINPPSAPIPLPQRQSPMAPHFDPKNSSTLCTYISDYELLAKAAQLTPAKQLAQSTCYLTKEDKDDWENLPEFEATFPDWDAFKEALFREY